MQGQRGIGPEARTMRATGHQPLPATLGQGHNGVAPRRCQRGESASVLCGSSSAYPWLSRWDSWATAARWAGGGRRVVHGLSTGSRAAARPASGNAGLSTDPRACTSGCRHTPTDSGHIARPCTRHNLNGEKNPEAARRRCQAPGILLPRLPGWPPPSRAFRAPMPLPSLCWPPIRPRCA